MFINNINCIGGADGPSAIYITTKVPILILVLGGVATAAFVGSIIWAVWRHCRKK